jgi:hypothetical protein
MATTKFYETFTRVQTILRSVLEGTGQGCYFFLPPYCTLSPAFRIFDSDILLLPSTFSFLHLVLATEKKSCHGLVPREGHFHYIMMKSTNFLLNVSSRL